MRSSPPWGPVMSFQLDCMSSLWMGWWWRTRRIHLWPAVGPAFGFGIKTASAFWKHKNIHNVDHKMKIGHLQNVIAPAAQPSFLSSTTMRAKRLPGNVCRRYQPNMKEHSFLIWELLSDGLAWCILRGWNTICSSELIALLFTSKCQAIQKAVCVLGVDSHVA